MKFKYNELKKKMTALKYKVIFHHKSYPDIHRREKPIDI